MDTRIKNILIVEDSRTQAEELKYLLENNNCYVRHALNGELALEILRSFVPEVIISDIVMPGMDGFTLCSVIKSDTQLKHIPVILLTALSDSKDVIKGLECGADSFLVKPYSEEFLIARIEYFLQNTELRKDLADDAPLEILFGQEKYTIGSSRRQIMDLLLANYENSMMKNQELIESNKSLQAARDNLNRMNTHLDQMVRVRTQELENSNANLKAEIEERKRVEIELIAAKEKVDEASRLKSAFLANMSHELRTPLNAIMGFSDLMTEADPDEKDRYAQIVYKSSNHLLGLLDDVFFVSRLQSEKLTLNLTEFKPAEMVNNAFKIFNQPDSVKKLDFRVLNPIEYSQISVTSDAGKVSQVLTHLLSNALKYTFSGYVEFGFDIRNGFLEFFVKDTGIGIDEKEQESIFDAFYRGQLAKSSIIGGAGLGLNIAKMVVELLGGETGVQSEPGKGSRFHFTIPMVSPELVSA
jgi:signal transduction histidine kinase